jgi:phosphoribosyl 1,2-cyclic phosphate phosphodiesterase
MSFRHPATTDVSGEMIFLGTGTSVGVPMLGCNCAVCTSDDPRNNRTRCSVLFGLPEGNLLVDTTPDLRTQLLRERIGVVHAVAFTHEHADHLFGLDDLRLFQFYIGGPVPLYCEPRVEDRIRRSNTARSASSDFGSATSPIAPMSAIFPTQAGRCSKTST